MELGDMATWAGVAVAAIVGILMAIIGFWQLPRTRKPTTNDVSATNHLQTANKVRETEACHELVRRVGDAMFRLGETEYPHGEGDNVAANMTSALSALKATIDNNELVFTKTVLNFALALHGEIQQASLLGTLKFSGLLPKKQRKAMEKADIQEARLQEVADLRNQLFKAIEARLEELEKG